MTTQSYTIKVRECCNDWEIEHTVTAPDIDSALDAGEAWARGRLAESGMVHNYYDDDIPESSTADITIHASCDDDSASRSVNAPLGM